MSKQQPTAEEIRASSERLQAAVQEFVEAGARLGAACEKAAESLQRFGNDSTRVSARPARMISLED